MMPERSPVASGYVNTPVLLPDPPADPLTT